MDISHEYLCTFMTIPRGIPPPIRNVSDKIVERFKTHILRSINFISGKRAVYEIMWKEYFRTFETDRPQIIQYDAQRMQEYLHTVS
jgi:hypothetical protein